MRSKQKLVISATGCCAHHTLPSGVNWSENSDSTNTDMGETRFYGTPNAGTEGTYTMKILGTYPRGRYF